MTLGRYLYRLVWRKLGAPLILLCAVLALSLTFYHHLKSNTELTPLKLHQFDISRRHDVHEMFAIADLKNQTSSLLRIDASNVHWTNNNIKRIENQDHEIDHDMQKEIDIQDSFFDDLRKPHVHIGGGVVDQITTRRMVNEFVILDTKNPNDEKNDNTIDEENEYDDGVGNANYFDSFLPSDLLTNGPLKPNRKATLYYKPSNPPREFTEWLSTESKQCDSKFIGINQDFALLKHVIVDKSKFMGRNGGEDIQQVINQDELLEYYKYEMGCFQLSCEDRIDYYFNNANHLAQYLFNVKTKNVDTTDFVNKIGTFTIAVTRYEYANLYHTMTDWYNAFLVMNFLNQTQSETSILLIDGHPRGALDKTWSVLFKSVQRISNLESKTKYKRLAWNALGYNSNLLRFELDSNPLVDEFREFFLNSFNVNADKKLSCDKLNILFIWRRNYIAHPRNPQGVISRKIRNERKLLSTMKRIYRDHHISGVQIDLFSMEQQLKLIAETDVLIGMHGAGLTHAMFLPPHAALIELVPTYWSSMDHFLSISKWRGLWYERWINNDPMIEIMDQSTRIPPGVVSSLLKSVLRLMACIKPIDEN